MLWAEQKKGDWGTFIATLVVVGMLGAWALIPTRIMELAWQAEQHQVSRWAGQASERWVRAQASGVMLDFARSAKEASDSLGASAIDHWLRNRIYTSLLWVSLAVYRASALIMWTLLGLPLILAASVDAFYVREIRKTSFVSQSPIRHKIGVHLFRLFSLAIVVWLLAPLPMPAAAAPLVVALMAFSLWLWVSNLQKRL